MVGSLGAQLALLAFSGAVLLGLVAGNTPETILIRALLVMVVAMFIGQFAGMAIKLVLREHLQARKRAIDEQHVQGSDGPIPQQPAAEPEATAPTAAASNS